MIHLWKITVSKNPEVSRPTFSLRSRHDTSAPDGTHCAHCAYCKHCKHYAHSVHSVHSVHTVLYTEPGGLRLLLKLLHLPLWERKQSGGNLGFIMWFESKRCKKKQSSVQAISRANLTFFKCNIKNSSMFTPR